MRPRRHYKGGYLKRGLNQTLTLKKELIGERVLRRGGHCRIFTAHFRVSYNSRQKSWDTLQFLILD